MRMNLRAAVGNLWRQAQAGDSPSSRDLARAEIQSRFGIDLQSSYESLPVFGRGRGGQEVFERLDRGRGVEAGEFRERDAGEVVVLVP